MTAFISFDVRGNLDDFSFRFKFSHLNQPRTFLIILGNPTAGKKFSELVIKFKIIRIAVFLIVFETLSVR